MLLESLQISVVALRLWSWATSANASPPVMSQKAGHKKLGAMPPRGYGLVQVYNPDASALYPELVKENSDTLRQV